MSEFLADRQAKIERMKEIIRSLHQGTPVEEVREKFRTLVAYTDPHEIAAMEEQLLAEGIPVGELCQMCDLHSQVVRETIAPQQLDFPPGHPVDTFRRENQAILNLVDEIGKQLQLWAKTVDSEEAHKICLRILEGINRLQDIDKHYKRKEYCLFPYLERHGITGPSQVMWAKDDQIRQKLNRFSESLRSSCPHVDSRQRAELMRSGQDMLAEVVEMVQKEEDILLPLAARTLSEEEWQAIWAQSPQYGWCLIAPETTYRPAPAAQLRRGESEAGAIEFPTGQLTKEQLVAILRTLPIDITFVDENDRVAYFSDGPERIFDRNIAILRRKVQHCHPPKSVHVVEQILEDFRSGRQNVAEFWINFQGKFVHIRYFAVRDEAGRYLGTLEVTQDATRIRGLEGERRLLQYES